jgi:hypothetical protein
VPQRDARFGVGPCTAVVGSAMGQRVCHQASGGGETIVALVTGWLHEPGDAAHQAGHWMTGKVTLTCPSCLMPETMTGGPVRINLP